MILHNPMEIEKKSFEIITSELTVKLPVENELVVKRVIHATADFDFAENLTAITNTMTKSRLFINSSTNQFASLAFADKVWTTNTEARKDAEALWSDMLSIIKENWSEWSKNV